MTVKPKSVVLHNALATAEVDKASGTVTNYHCNDGINLVREIHIDGKFLAGPCDRFEVIQRNSSLLDISFVFLRRLPEEAKSSRGLQIELHYAMQPDTPGVYTYFV